MKVQFSTVDLLHYPTCITRLVRPLCIFFFIFLVNWKLRVSRISVIYADISLYLYLFHNGVMFRSSVFSVASVHTAQRTQSLRIITAKHLNEVCIIFVLSESKSGSFNKIHQKYQT